MFKQRRRGALIASAALIAGVITDAVLNTGVVLPQAQAVIGRPLTPLSYAGVARRTTRRAIYATSVYRATLPAGCRTLVIEGTTLHQCGATYYQASGGQYVVVKVQ